MKSLNVTDARNQLLDLVDELSRKPSMVVGIQKRGKPVMALISAKLYDSIVETLEILADEDLMAQFRKAVKEIEAGKGIPLTASKKRLGLA